MLYCSLHASATWIRVTVQQSDCSLIFEDDGVGISVDELESFQSTPLQEAILLVLENQLSENFTTFIRLVSSICDISVISRQPNQERSNYLEIRKGQVGHNPIHSLFSPYFLGHQIQAIASLSSLWKQSKHSYFLSNAMSLKNEGSFDESFLLFAGKKTMATNR